MGGLATYGKKLAFEGALVNGTAYYAGLLTTLPTADDGTALVEATGSGYARIGHSAWINKLESSVWYRVNDGTIEFAELTADLDDVLGWGIWTAVSGGSLIAWGPLLDQDENEITRTYSNGNQPRFVDQELKAGLD